MGTETVAVPVEYGTMAMYSCLGEESRVSGSASLEVHSDAARYSAEWIVLADYMLLCLLGQ